MNKKNKIKALYLAMLIFGFGVMFYFLAINLL